MIWGREFIYFYLYVIIYTNKKKKKKKYTKLKKENKRNLKSFWHQTSRKETQKIKDECMFFLKCLNILIVIKNPLLFFEWHHHTHLGERERDNLITPNKCFFSINTLKHIKTYTHCFFYLQIFFEDDKKNEWSLNVFLFFHVLVFSFF